MWRSISCSALLVLGAAALAGCGGTSDDLYDQTAQALGAAQKAENSNTLLQVNIEWTGDVGNFKAEVHSDRDWHVEDAGVGIQKINGKSKYTVKTEAKDKEEGDKTKLSFEYEAEYHDVLVRSSDGAFIGGEINTEVKGKISEKTDETKIKEEWKIKAVVTYSESGEGVMLLDESVKYKVKVDGETTIESRT